MRVPINEMGAFNLWAWQFMWIFGMWCGVRWARGEMPAQRWAARVWIPGVAVALALLAALTVPPKESTSTRTAPIRPRTCGEAPGEYI